MKTKINNIRYILTLALILSGLASFAQETSRVKIYHIETTDGNSYTGQVVSSDSVKVLLRTEKLGDITILHSDIRKKIALEASQVKGNKIWLENPQSTRYFFSPNGYGLKKGEGYYQNVWVLVNSFAVGINDYVSIGGGIIPLFLFAGAPTPAYITAKVSVPVVKEKFNLGAGILAGTALGASDTEFGIFYGIATVGSRDLNASLGMGYGFVSGSFSKAPMININGMARIGPRGYLLTENYIFSDSNSTTVILSIGGRTIIKDAGLDYGLLLPVSTGDGFIAIPWLGITIPFGKHK
ncbi:MAG: hypothetical protein WCP08_12450 [Prolixibacteraceae bacterium]